MQKRGQLTTFILVGIVLFVIIVLFLVYKQPFPEVDYSKPTSFQHYVESCLEDTARFALFQVGLQGGYVDLPAVHFTQSHLKVAYAWNNGEKFVSLQTMQEELAAFVEGNFLACIEQGIELFRKRFGEIQFQDPVTKVFIQQEDVRFQLEFPVTIKDGDGTTTLDKPYSVTVPVRLHLLHETIKSILAEKEGDTDLSLVCRFDPQFTLHGIGYEGETLYILEDTGSFLLDSPDRVNHNYRFFFAVRD